MTSCPGFVWVLSVSSDREVFELLLLSGVRPAREGEEAGRTFRSSRRSVCGRG